MLTIEHIRASFGSVVALSDVSMEVDEGTVHGVIGPNGAGKSTLMNVLSGTLRPKRGTVRLDGMGITTKSIQWRRRHGLSRSFQRTSIFPALSVSEQLLLVARGDSSQVAQVAKTFNLQSVLDKRADTIAYGDQRRVDIALAVVGDARLLLLDEPAAGLTVQETADLFGHLTEFVHQDGLTALIVEHDVDAVFGSCDVVTVLDLGSVIMTDSPGTVRTDPRVIEAYLGSAA